MAPGISVVTFGNRMEKRKDNVDRDDQSNQNNVKRYKANDDSGERPGKKHMNKNDDKPEDSTEMEERNVKRLGDREHHKKTPQNDQQTNDPFNFSSDDDSYGEDVSDDSTTSDVMESLRKPSKNIGKKSQARFPVRGKNKVIIHRVCPLCFKLELTTNMTRHLRQVHKIHDQKRLDALSYQASVEGRRGMRPVFFEDLPSCLKDFWKEAYIRRITKEFLYKLQMFLVKTGSEDEREEVDEITSSQHPEEEEEEEGEEEEMNDSEDMVSPEQMEKETEKISSKARLKELPYPILSNKTPLLKAMRKALVGKGRTEKQIQSFLGQAGRILGYVAMKHDEDTTGFALLTDGERASEYIVSVLSQEAKLSPSTVKSYALTFRDMITFVLDDLFDDETLKKLLEKNLNLLEDLKKSLRRFKVTLQSVVENVHLHNAANLLLRDGEEPDVRIWDRFLDVKKQHFEDCLSALENASDKEFSFFETSPGLSDLRAKFNFVVGYIAVFHILKSAARPGEFANCQLDELENPELTAKGEHIIHIALHKTGNAKMAQIFVKHVMWLNIQRYSNIVKRFKKTSITGIVKKRKVVLAFPYASTSSFKVHPNVYHVLNDWCTKNKQPHFTANILRKVTETTVEHEHDPEKREKVRKGLNHSGSTARKYYKKIESQTIESEKIAVEKSINLSKAFSFVKKAEFDVNVFEGRLSREKFFQMIAQMYDYEDSNELLYETYCTHWLRQAEPKVIETICDSHITDRNELETVLNSVLSIEEFLPRKADIARQVRQKLGFE